MEGERFFSKKNILKTFAVIVSVFIIAASAIVWAVNKSDNFGITYEQAMKDNKPFVAMFHSQWCSYCKMFKPTYKNLSEQYKGKYNFVMIDGEDPLNATVMNDYAIGSFPTIYIIDPTIDNRVLISNTIYGDLNRLRSELDRYLRVRAMIK